MSDSGPSDSQKESLSYIISITSILGIISTSTVIIYYYTKIKLHSIEGLMIVMILLGDLLNSIGLLVPILVFWGQNVDPIYYESIGCALQACTVQLGVLLQFAWAFLVGYAAYRATFRESKEQLAFRMKYINSLGIIIPLALTFIPLIMNDYGPVDSIVDGSQLTQALCFINSSDLQGNIAIQITFLIPMILVLICNSYFFIYVCRYIAEQIGKVSSRQIYYQLLIYPLILFVCYFWFIILFYIGVITKIEMYNYQIFCYGMSNISGVLDAAAYGTKLLSAKDQDQQQISGVVLTSIHTTLNSQLTEDFDKQ